MVESLRTDELVKPGSGTVMVMGAGMGIVTRRFSI